MLSKKNQEIKQKREKRPKIKMAGKSELLRFKKKKTEEYSKLYKVRGGMRYDHVMLILMIFFIKKQS